MQSDQLSTWHIVSIVLLLALKWFFFFQALGAFCRFYPSLDNFMSPKLFFYRCINLCFSKVKSDFILS